MEPRPAVAPAPKAEPAPRGPEKALAAWRALEARVAAMPEAVRELAAPGLRAVVDYQDVAYGAEYLDRLDRALEGDGHAQDWAFSRAAAKHLANAMRYDDVIRVADLKTRASREARVRAEVRPPEGAVLHVTEYFHPRMEEICGTMPAALGRWIEARPKLMGWLDRRVNRGRRIRSDSLGGWLSLWAVSALRPWRRSLLRHAVETRHLEAWFGLALATRAKDYALGVEVLECRRLVKGYSDTHARGLSKFDRVLSGLDLLEGRPDAADWLRRLRTAALQDEKGEALDGALRTIASL